MLLNASKLGQESNKVRVWGFFSMFVAAALPVSFNNSRGVRAAWFELSFLCEVVSCLSTLV